MKREGLLGIILLVVGIVFILNAGSGITGFVVFEDVGASAEAAAKVIQKVGGVIEACVFVIELPDLGGRKRLEASGYSVRSICEFEGE